MNALLLIADDAVSANIWQLNVRAALESGKTVLAITDVANTGNLIGIGDDLPEYSAALTEHPAFINRKVGLDELELLETELKSLRSDTVVVWNVDVFELAAKEPKWRGVLDSCLGTDADKLFIHFTGRGIWMRGTPDLAESIVADLPWDYIAGSCVWTPSSKGSLAKSFPHFALQLKTLPSPKNPDSGARWQVLTKNFGLDLRAPVRDLGSHKEVLNTLAWGVPVPVKRPDSNLLRSLSRRFLR